MEDGAQLDHVQAPLAHFYFADKGLALADALGKLNLRNARRLPSLAEQSLSLCSQRAG